MVKIFSLIVILSNVVTTIAQIHLESTEFQRTFEKNILSETDDSNEILDLDLPVLYVLDTIKFELPTTHTKQVYFEQAVLVDADSIVWDLNSQQVGIVTLGGDRVLKTPLNQVAGGHYTLIIKQDETGARSLQFNNNYKFPNGSMPHLSSLPNAVDIMSCVSDKSNLFCNLISDYR